MWEPLVVGIVIGMILDGFRRRKAMTKVKTCLEGQDLILNR